MNKEIFTVENVVNALEIDLGINHKSNLVRYHDSLDITGALSFSFNDKKVLDFELFENGNLSLCGYMKLKTDIEGNLIFPILIKNKDYLKKLNDLNKFYSLFFLLNRNNKEQEKQYLSLHIDLFFDKNVQILTESIDIYLIVSNGNNHLNIEIAMRKTLATYGIEDQFDTNSPEEICSLIEMIRV